MNKRFSILICILLFAGLWPVQAWSANIMDTLFYGVVARENGDIARARMAFSEVVERDPQNAYAWLQLGIINAISGNTDGALRMFDRANTAGGERFSRLWRVMALLRDDKDNEAAAELQKLLQEAPQSALADYLMGLLSCRQGLPVQALEYFEKSQSRNAPGAEIHYLLARAFESMDMPVNARIEYETALEYEPTHARALIGLSRVFAQTGETNLAQRSLEQLLASNPQSAEAATLLSRYASDKAFEAWSKKDRETAQRFWRKALEYDRQNEAALYYLRTLAKQTAPEVNKNVSPDTTSSAH